MKPKALFASDIDHTLTGSDHIIPDRVAKMLTDLYHADFEVLLLTGRTLSFALNSVGKLSFPFFLALQNGAEILQMPERTLFAGRYLPKSFILELEEWTREIPGDFIVYTGVKSGDLCYYRKGKFDRALLTHIEHFSKIAAGKWQEIGQFSEMEGDAATMVKYMGPLEGLEKIKKIVEEKTRHTVYLMKDAIDRKAWILLITEQEATKGSALLRIVQEKDWKAPIITAGDDNNDLSLLREGDVKIAMIDGSHLLIELADIVAKPSKEMGIIEALEKARKRFGI